MTNWTTEDVEHIDMLIAEAMEHEGTVALPGAEHVRNQIARAVGLPEADEGGVTWGLVRETDYSPRVERPVSNA